MAATINFGIDLGTSNSLIARFDRGQVEVFKNPNGFKETLPSVVGFRSDRILVGDQARAYAERDAKSVFGRFKRKMGTSETFKVQSLGTSKTPVELSAQVLKELKGFVQTGEEVDAAVVTIPASFDTVQCNATQEAGRLAGFKTVVLLQEPIAASLAYSNKVRRDDLRNSQWLVYDLGGGTFDVALVRIVEGELTVLDHEGDNYLGGSDFDSWIVEKIVVPELERRGKFQDLLGQLHSGSGRYNRLWYRLLYEAERAKIELSAKTSAEIELDGAQGLEDDEGRAVGGYLSITRSEFESVVKEAVDRTIDMMKQILTRNSLRPADLKFILMVGGATYSPFVRRRVEEVMGIAVNTSIDPTNAIAIGAAYYAGTKERASPMVAAGSRPAALKVRASYNKASQDREETFTAKVEGAVPGMQYRIVGDDGAFDTGLKALGARIVEDLPLREEAFNLFTLKVFDASGNPVAIDLESIQIAQGKYSVAGQMLPDDLSLVIDDLSAKDTRLDQLLQRNAVLPARVKRTKEVAKTVVKDSDDEIRIMVVEGPASKHSSTNKPIGVLSISGRQISRDLIRGTEVDLTFEVSESRILTVSAYLNGTGQEFSQVFTPAERHVSSRLLASDIVQLQTKVVEELRDAEQNANHDTARGLEGVLERVETLVGEAANLTEDDVTDRKFQLEDRKRRLAQEVFDLTSSKRLEKARGEYEEARTRVAELVRTSGNDHERHVVAEISARERVFLTSNSPDKIQAATDQLEQIRWRILFRTPQFLVGMLRHLMERRTSMNDQELARQLFEGGRRAVEQEDWDELRQINWRLWDLMPGDELPGGDPTIFTGIV